VDKVVVLLPHALPVMLQRWQKHIRSSFMDV
jgi:hypothetical protein